LLRSKWSVVFLGDLECLFVFAFAKGSVTGRKRFCPFKSRVSRQKSRPGVKKNRGRREKRPKKRGSIRRTCPHCLT